ncbi:hypothetical protein GCM10025859_38810 [Alicyclobacillus fastidiosus]|nr:hypothetical protein GCM10025859_38810 [Alicyclobacillus fastidiosus]
MGRVFLVGAGPGDPLLLTLKAKAVLEKADVVVYDRLVSQSILEFAADAAEMIYVGKSPNHHTLPQREIDALLVKKAREGHTVVRLKGETRSSSGGGGGGRGPSGPWGTL